LGIERSHVLCKHETRNSSDSGDANAAFLSDYEEMITSQLLHRRYFWMIGPRCYWLNCHVRFVLQAITQHLDQTHLQ